MVFFLKKRKIIRTYDQYREIGKELNSKIFDRYVDRNVFLKCGKLLGLVKRDTFIIDEELDTIALMDFSLNEYQINGKSAVELYKENVLLDNTIEENTINALIRSYTSIFEIIDVKRHKYSIVLNDILNSGSDPIELIDKGFSLTASVGLNLFLRVIPLDEFNMNGGFGFAFQGDLREYLLKEYKYLVKQIKSSSESLKRFIVFFKLNKQHGIEIRFM
jgi:hypothetical protein